MVEVPLSLPVIASVGATLSMLTCWLFTASAFPALSKARYLTVAVADTVNAPLYVVPFGDTASDAVGVEPSVVYRISFTPEPPALSVAASVTETFAL